MNQGFGFTLVAVAICAASNGCENPSANAKKNGEIATETAQYSEIPAEIGPVVQPQIAEQPLLRAPVSHQNLSIAVQLLTSGQFIDAEIVLRAILKESPDCARAEFLLGVAMLKQKQYGQARPLLESSLARQQDFSGRKQVEHFLGWACYYLGDLDASKRAFQSHVRAVPTADDSYYGLAIIALDEDRTSDAAVALERAMELIGTDPARNRERAKVVARLGDLEVRRENPSAAISLYEEALALFPDHYEIWGKIARLYDSEGRPADADRARKSQQAAMARVGRSTPTDVVP